MLTERTTFNHLYGLLGPEIVLDGMEMRLIFSELTREIPPTELIELSETGSSESESI